MNITKLKTLSLTLLFLITGACMPQEQPRNIAPGDKIPDFSITLSDDRQITNKDIEGKQAILSFLNPEDENGFKQMLRLEDFHKESPTIDIIALCLNDSELSVKMYWAAWGITYPYSLQKDLSFYKQLVVEGNPFTIYAENGIVIGTWADDNLFEKKY